MAKPEIGKLKVLMAKRCDWCPPCNYARKHPDSTVGKAIAFHGKFCPFWKAWQEVYGDQGPEGSEA